MILHANVAASAARPIAPNDTVASPVDGAKQQNAVQDGVPEVKRTTVSSAVAGDLLSPREGSVLQLIGEGNSNKEIARILGIAPETVKSHVKRIFLKLSVAKRAQAVSLAYSLGLFRSNCL